jgi:DNA-binding transcriptional MerR regulator
MGKSADAFRTISEVADWLGVQAHVLRFWESKFTQIKPVKRAGGRRYYRPNDMRLIGGIKHLLHDDGLTIKGVQKILRDEGVAHVAGFSKSLDDLGVDEDAAETVEEVKTAPAAKDDTPPKTADTSPEKTKAADTPVETPIEAEDTEAPFVEAEEEQTDAEVVLFDTSSDDPAAKPTTDPTQAPANPVAATDDAPAAKTSKISMPDLPPVDDSTPDAGVLHHIFACKTLTPKDATAIQPLMDRLQGLRDQMAAQHR